MVHAANKERHSSVNNYIAIAERASLEEVGLHILPYFPPSWEVNDDRDIGKDDFCSVSPYVI